MQGRRHHLISFSEREPTSSLVEGNGNVRVVVLGFFDFFYRGSLQIPVTDYCFAALIYALLTAGLVCRYGVNNYLLAAFCSVLAVSRLQSAIVHTKSNAPVFGFGLFTCLAVLLCPKLVMLLLWAIVVLPFSGRANIKDLSALLIGFLTALLFTAAYYFWTDQLSEAPDIFMKALQTGEGFWKLMHDKLAAYVVFGILIVISLHNVIVNYPTAIVSQRRGIFAMLSMLLFAGSTLFFVPFNCHGIMLILAIPLSYLFSQYFISHRTRWLGNVLFVLLLVACVVTIL